MPAPKTGVVFNLGTRPINVHAYQDQPSHQNPKTTTAPQDHVSFRVARVTVGSPCAGSLSTRGAHWAEPYCLSAQIAARRTKDTPAGIEGMDADLTALLDTRVDDLERRIESVIA